MAVPLKDAAMIDYQFQAGRLKYFLGRWKVISAPPVILKLISNFRIPFLRKPPLILPTSTAHQTLDTPQMSAEIQKMLESNVIEVAPTTPSFVSPMFLVMKPDQSYRPIFNLKSLNEFISVRKFYLLSHFEIPKFLQPGDWLTKIDMSQAYFHVNVSLSRRRFLRLIYNVLPKDFKSLVLP